MSRTMPNTLQIDLMAEPDIQGMVRELEAARFTLAQGDAFHAMTPEEQARAVVDLVMYSRAAVVATPELKAWVNAGKH